MVSVHFRIRKFFFLRLAIVASQPVSEASTSTVAIVESTRRCVVYRNKNKQLRGCQRFICTAQEKGKIRNFCLYKQRWYSGILRTGSKNVFIQNTNEAPPIRFHSYPPTPFLKSMLRPSIAMVSTHKSCGVISDLISVKLQCFQLIEQN